MHDLPRRDGELVTGGVEQQRVKKPAQHRKNLAIVALGFREAQIQMN
ncbi:hypothetical protein J2W34_006533 [Variovorax boronicumulans]|nr:hypothetical protein [Variovorax boronicumulans]MDQ0074707.1 hypothetical protein [Variovorax boronicumulans]